MFIERENKTELVIDISVLLTQNPSSTEAEKIQNINIWPWKLKVSGSLTAYVCSHEPSQLKEWLPETSQISRAYRFNEKHLKSGAKGSIIPILSYSMQIPRTHFLTLEDKTDFLALTEPYPTNTLG